MQMRNERTWLIAVLCIAAAFAAACSGTSGSGSGGDNEAAADVNGKVITMEEVDREVKVQSQGQESKLSLLPQSCDRLNPPSVCVGI